jgi:hypothetical protein
VSDPGRHFSGYSFVAVDKESTSAASRNPMCQIRKEDSENTTNKNLDSG